MHDSLFILLWTACVFITHSTMPQDKTFNPSRRFRSFSVWVDGELTTGTAGGGRRCQAPFVPDEALGPSNVEQKSSGSITLL